jgi:signal transduction histidine kinase
VLAVLAAVVLPFGGFAVFVDYYVARRSLEVVKQALLGLATDLAREIDRELEDHRDEMYLWAAEPRNGEAVRESASDRAGGGWGVAETRAIADGRAPLGPGRDLRREETRAFDRYVRTSGAYDLLLLVDASGRLVACNSVGRDGEPLPPAVLDRVFACDYASLRWFAEARERGVALVDHHRSELMSTEAATEDDIAATYGIGLARALQSSDGRGEFVGVLYGLVNWSVFNDLLLSPLVKDYFRGMVPENVLPSPYAWIWGSDADTILAHQKVSLIGRTVSGPGVGLPEMVEDARSGAAGRPGMFREYEFDGVKKNAAFMRSALAPEGGFGWYIGVGINNEDIFAVTVEISEVLYKGTAAVLLACVLWMLVIARRTTSPILALQEHTRRVAAGDLDARVEINTKDELGELADAFNRMTRDLAENREALIKAEKDAAWREMARQIAHDIKNPLTPIKLSIDLLARARSEGRADFETILERTLGLMDRQVENLREIATDFYEFTGGRKPRPARLATDELIREVIQLHGAWAESQGVELETRGEGRVLWADGGKLRRVLTNLVSNAVQSMPDGGKLEIIVDACPLGVRIDIVDDGPGLSDEVRERLFEPFFTTKTEGTGLGLAISKRVMEEMAGHLELLSREGRAGTIARVELPLPPSTATS